MKAKLEFKAARQQKMKAKLEFGGDAGWTKAELQKMDDRTIVKVIVLSSAFAFFAPTNA
jgi:hypothetical protein